MASPFLNQPANFSQKQSDKQARERGGFNCEFVQPPPDVLQSECPVCLQIIREPHQVTCCGKKFCRSCIEHIKAINKPCPTCNDKEFSDFPDKGVKQLLYSQKVRCSHQKDGCEWTGELRQLDEHLNTDPLPGKQLNGCPLTTISCDFLHVGCSVKLPRKVMPEHLRENLITHISLLATSHAKQQLDSTEQQAQIAHLVMENEKLKKAVATLSQSKSEMSAASQNPVILRTRVPIVQSEVLTMTNFQQHKRDDSVWYSPPVYTHHQGYKICLKVFANGTRAGTGTHVSVYVYFMRGEFDDSLKWPFRGVILYQLLDQVKGEDHVMRRSLYDENTEDKYCSRVMYADRANNGFGLVKFISHNSLDLKHLQKDSLQFQICGGEAYI